MGKLVGNYLWFASFVEGDVWKGRHTYSLHKVRRTCRTSPATIKNVRQMAPVKFNQMSGEEVKMSGQAKKNFV